MILQNLKVWVRKMGASHWAVIECHDVWVAQLNGDNNYEIRGALMELGYVQITCEMKRFLQIYQEIGPV